MRPRRFPSLGARGFSLVELMVTMVIIAVLGSVSYVAYAAYTAHVQDQVAIVELEGIHRSSMLLNVAAAATEVRTVSYTPGDVTDSVPTATQTDLTALSRDDSAAQLLLVGAVGQDGSSGGISTRRGLVSAAISAGPDAQPGGQLNLAQLSDSGRCVFVSGVDGMVTTRTAVTLPEGTECRANSTGTPTPGAPPPVSTLLAVVSGSGSGVDLTWEVPQDAPAGRFVLYAGNRVIQLECGVTPGIDCTDDTITYTDPGGVEWDNYQIAYCTVDGTDCSDLSEPITAAEGAPLAPRGDASTGEPMLAATPTDVTLTWILGNAVTAVPVDGFNIYRCSGANCDFGSQPYVNLPKRTTESNSFTDKNVLQGQILCYKLTAYNGAGESESSNVACVTVPHMPSLHTPTVTATAGDNSVHVDWGAIDNAVRYEVYVNGELAGTTRATAYTVGALTNGSHYRMQVIAYGSYGQSSQPSTGVTVRPLPQRLKAPTNVDLTPNAGSLSLVADPPPGAVSYRIYVDGDLWQTANELPTTITGLTNGQTYSVEVAAVDTFGQVGTKSDPVSQTVGGGTGAGIPQNFRAQVASERLTFLWTNRSGASYYKLYYRIYESGTPFSLLRTNISNSPTTVTGLTNGTRYEVYATSVSFTGVESDPSTHLVRTPNAPWVALDTPQVSGVALDGGVQLSWAAVDGADAYRIINQDGDLVATTSNTQRTINSLPNGSPLRFYVIAVSGSLASGSVCDNAGTSVGNCANSTTSRWSSPGSVLVTPLPPPPSATFNLQVNSQNRGMRVSFLPVPGAVNYQVLVNGSVFANSHVVSGTNADGYTTYTSLTPGCITSAGRIECSYLNGLTNGRTYHVAIRAVDEFGQFSALSPATPVVPLPDLPRTPTGLIVQRVHNGLYVHVDPSDASTMFNVYANGILRGSFSRNNGTLTNLPIGSTATIQVSAIDSYGQESAPTAGKPGRPLPNPLPTPANATAVGADGRVTLTWDAVPGAVSYQVATLQSVGGPGGTNGCSYSSNGLYTPLNTPCLGWVSVSNPTATHAVITGLSNGSSYNFRVYAVDGYGQRSATGAAVSGTPWIPISAPANLVAESLPGRLYVSWDPVPGAQWYNVYANGVLRASVDPSADPSAFVNGLTNGVWYTITVKAVDSSSLEGLSATVSARPLPSIPVAPFNVVAQAGDGQFQVEWEAPANAATYQLWVDGAKVSDSVTTPHVVTGMTNGTTYLVQLAAVDAYGRASGLSAPVAVTPSAASVDAPSGVALTTDSGQLTASWNPVASAVEYTVYLNGVAHATVTTAHATITGLTNGDTYTVTVDAVNSEGTHSAPSLPTQIMVAPPAPSAPTGLLATTDDRSADFTWDPVAGASAYNVFVNGVLVGSANTTSFHTSDLTNGTVYSAVVTAVDEFGQESGPSNSISFTPYPQLLNAPSSVTVAPGNRQVLVAWHSVSSAASYRVFVNGNPTNVGSVTSYAVTGLTPLAEVSIRVAAIDAFGREGNRSATVTGSAYPDQLNAPVLNTDDTHAADQSMTVAWQAVSGATVYRVKVRIGGEYQIAVATTDLSATLDTLPPSNAPPTNGTSYDLQVVAVDYMGQEGHARSLSLTPLPTAPAAPTNVVATGANRFATVTWDAVPGAVSYQVFLDDDTTPAATVTDAAATVTDLDNGTDYLVSVVAVDAFGQSSPPSIAATVTPRPDPLPAPPAVTVVNADDVTGASLTVSWTSVPAAAGYRVFRDGVPVALIGPPATTTTLNGLTPGQEYSIQVAAVDADNFDGELSDPVSATGTQSPKNVVATAADSAGTLTWTASDNATGYEVWLGEILQTTTTEPTATLTGLTNGQTYPLRVRARYASGASSQDSATVSLRPVPPAPAAPATLTGTASDAAATLNWTAVPGVSIYRVFTGATQNQQVVQVVGTSATLTGLLNNTDYTYTVRAVDPYGQMSTATSPVTVRPLPAPLPAPVEVIANPGDAQVDVTASNVPGATSYAYYLDGSEVTTHATTSVVLTGLTNGQTYQVQVAAIDAYGQRGALSEAVATTPQQGALPAPVNVSATGGDASVSLTWDAVPGATSYRVYREGEPVALSTVLTPAATLSDLDNGTTYRLRVAAVNAFGEQSPLSQLVSARPLPPRLPAPTDPLVAPSNNAVTLSWAPVANAVVYNVYVDGQLRGSRGVNSMAVSPLTNGTSYSLEVAAVDEFGQEGHRSTPVVGTPVPPAPVVTAAPVLASGNQQVTVSVPAGTASGLSADVYRDGVKVSSTPTRTFIDTGLVNGRSYDYSVMLVDSYGQRSNMSPVSFGVPHLPTVVNVRVATGDGILRPSWDAVAHATGYTIIVSDVSTNQTLQTLTSTTTHATITGLTNGTPYAVRVGATSSTDPDASGRMSTPVSAIPSPGPSAPTLAQVSARHGSAEAVWTAPVLTGDSPLASYTVTATAPGQPTLSCTVSASATRCTLNGLTRSVTYTVSVTATNDSGQVSPASNTLSTGWSSVGVDVPTHVAATAADRQIVVSWQHPEAWVSGSGYYRVTWGGFSSDTNTTVVSSSRTRLVISGLSNGTAYPIQVQYGCPTSGTCSAWNSAGWSTYTTASAPSTPVTVTPTASVIAAPTTVSHAPTNGGARVFWTAVDNAVGYRVYVDGLLTASTAAPGLYADLVLSPGSKTVTVTAVDGFGVESQPSNDITVTRGSSGYQTSPQNVTVEASSGQAVVSWSAPATWYTSSNQFYRVSVDGFATAANTRVVSPGVTSVLFSDLSNSTAYTAQVQACSGPSGCSTWDNFVWTSPSYSPQVSQPQPGVDFTPSGDAPAAPTNVAAVGQNGSARVTWTPSLGATSYALFVDGVETMSSTDPVYTNLPMSNGWHIVQLAAVNSQGSSVRTLPVSVNSSSGYQSSPQSVSVESSSGQAVVSWSAPATWYTSSNQYYRVSVDGFTTAANTRVVGPGVTSVLFSDLSNSTAYTAQVQACSGPSGCSTWDNFVWTSPSYSPQVSHPQTGVPFTPSGAAPAAPTNVSIRAGRQAIGITWTPSVGATEYRVYLNGSVVQTIPAGTPYALVPMTSAANVQLTAVNNSGESVRTVATNPGSPYGNTSTPTQVTASGGNGEVTVSWTAPAYWNSSSFRYYRVSVDGGATYSLAPGGGVFNPPTSMTVTGLANGQSYPVQVQACGLSSVSTTCSLVGGSGWAHPSYSSLATMPVIATTNADVLTAPTGLAGTAHAYALAATWTPVSGATGYQVYLNGVLHSTVTTSSVTIDGLTPNVTHSVQVSALSASGESALSAAVRLTPSSSGTRAVRNLLVVPGDGAVTVSWSLPLGWWSSTGRAIEVSVNGVPQVLAGTATSLTVAGLPNGEPQTVRVRACADGSTGCSVPAGTAWNNTTYTSVAKSDTVTPQADRAAAPTGLIASSTGAYSGSATWTAVSGATGYRVYIDGQPFATPTDTSLVLTGLANFTTYQVQVQALFASAPDSAVSLPASFLTTAAAQATPANVAATAGNGQIEVTWDAPESWKNSTSQWYRVTLDNAATSARTVTVAASSTRRVLFSGLTNDTAYPVRVQACSGDSACSGWSNYQWSSPAYSSANVIQQTVTPTATGPVSPTGLAAAAGNGVARITWNASASATGYRLLVNGQEAWVGTDRTVDLPLSNGSAHAVQVAAVNASGESLPSLAVWVTPQSTSQTEPQNVVAQAGSSQIVVTWEAPSVWYSSSYRYYRVTVDGGATSAKTVVRNTSQDRRVVISGLTNGVAYPVLVQACSGESGCSSWSDQAWSHSAWSARVSQPPLSPLLVTPEGLAPQAPTSASATPSNGSARVSWTTMPTATSYHVYVDGVFTQAATSSPADVPMSNGSAHAVTVTAVNASGESLPSPTVWVSPQSTLQTEPQNVVAQAGSSQIVVTWEAPSVWYSSSYRYYRVTVDGGATSAKTVVRNTSQDRRVVISGLTNGVAYPVVVQACSSDSSCSNWNASQWSSSGYSHSVSQPPLAPLLVTPEGLAPQAPTSASATPSNGSARVSWTTMPTATSYHVYVDGVFTQAATSSPADVPMSNGSAHAVTVTAVNASGESLPSPTVWVTPQSTHQAAPQNVVAQAGNSQIVVTWDEPSVWSSSNYRYYRVTVDGGATSAKTVVRNTSDPRRVVISGLTNGVAYPVVVQACSSDSSCSNWNASQWSSSSYSHYVSQPPLSPLLVTTTSDVPVAPTGLNIAYPGDRSAGYTWNAVANADAYNIYLDGVLVHTAPARSPLYALVHSPTGSSYLGTATISTVIDGVEGLATSDRATSVYSDSQNPPAAVTARATSASTATVSWQPPASWYNGNGTHRYYRVSLNPDPLTTRTAALTQVVSHTATSATFTGLSPDTTYPVMVQACSSDASCATWSGAAWASGYVNSSPWTTPLWITTATEPVDAPTGLSATATSSDTLVVTWNPVANATGYQLYVNGVLHTSTPSPTTTLRGLSSNTRYTLRVSATVDGVESAQSTPLDAATTVSAQKPPRAVAAIAGNTQARVTWTTPVRWANTTAANQWYRVRTTDTSGITTLSAPLPATRSSYTLTGLSNGADYDVEVQACSTSSTACGTGSNPVWNDPASTSPWVATDRITPTADAAVIPTELVARSGKGQAGVSWTPMSEQDSASVEVFANGQKVSTVASTPAIGYALVSDLPNGTVADITLVNVRPDGTRSLPTEAGLMTVTPVWSWQGGPRQVVATPGTSQILVSWDPPSNGATHYRITWGAASGSANTVVRSATEGTSYTITGVTNGQPYPVQVQACNPQGGTSCDAWDGAGWNTGGTSSPWSSVQVVTPSASLLPPAGLAATAGNQRATVTWNAAAAATSYQITTDDGATHTTTATTSETLTGLTNGREYSVKVRSRNVTGVSDWSDPITVTPQLPAPTQVSAVGGDERIVVEWSPVTHATGYHVSLDGVLVETVGSVDSVTLTGLDNGTTYQVTVTATSPGAESAPSTPVPATPTAPSVVPTAPTEVVAAGFDQTLAVSWLPVPTASGYQVFLDGNLVGTSTTPAYTARNLVNNTDYAVRVLAVNAAGPGPLSQEVTGTPRDTFQIANVCSDICSTLALAAARDGSVLAGGWSGDQNHGTLVRLRADGTVDPAFTTGTGFNGPVKTLVVQPDGKIVVGGSFTDYNGNPAQRLVRLTATGQLDTGFSVANAANANVSNIALQPDGKLVIVGSFTEFDGHTHRRIVRLNPDGSRDTGFDMGSGFDAVVNTVAVDASNRLLVGGAFSSYDGTTAHRIVRLKTNGRVDNTFDPGTGFGGNEVNAIALGGDGKIMVGGDVTSYNQNPVKTLVRLNASGARDTDFDFTAQPNSHHVERIGVQPNGVMFVTGTTTNSTYVVKVTSTGAEGSGATISNLWQSTALLPQPDNSTLIGRNVDAGYASVVRGDATEVLTIADTFDRTNDSTLSVTDTGLATWYTPRGTWEISDNQARTTTLAEGSQRAVALLHTPSDTYSLSVDLDNQKIAGVTVESDADHSQFLTYLLDGDTLRRRASAGMGSDADISLPAAPDRPVRLQFIASGSVGTLLVDGVVRDTVALPSPRGSFAGLVATETGALFDNVNLSARVSLDGERVIATDTFTAENTTDHTDTTSGTRWIVGSGRLGVQGNRGTVETMPVSGPGGVSIATPAIAVGYPDQSIAATATGADLGLAVRMIGGNVVSQSYLVVCAADGCELRRGTGTTAADTTLVSDDIGIPVLVAGDRLELSATGDTLRITHNDVLVHTTTMTGNNGGQQVGLVFATPATTAGQVRVDNVIVSGGLR